MTQAALNNQQHLTQAIGSFIKSFETYEVFLLTLKSDRFKTKLCDDVFGDVIEKFSGEVMLKVATSNSDLIIGKRACRVVCVSDPDQLQKIRNGKHILIVLINDEFKLENIFEPFWSAMIYNVNILTYTEANNSISMFSFKPFNSNSCSDTKVVKINEFNASANRWKSNNFFPDKFKNLHKCPLKVATYESAPALMINDTEDKIKIYGFEGDLFNEIAAELNFTIIVELTEPGGGNSKLLENGSSFGVIKKVVDGEVDIIFSLLSSSELRSKLLTPTYTYFIDRMILIVPPDSPLSPFRKLFCGFELKVWLSLFLTVLVIFIFYEGIKLKFSKFYHEIVIGRNIKNEYLNMFNSFLGGSLHVLPKLTFARYLLAMHLMFGLVVRSMYQGALYKNMKTNIYITTTKTIDDVNRNEYTFYLTQGNSAKLSDVVTIER